MPGMELLYLQVCITNAGMWTKQRDLLAMLVSAGIAVAKLSKMPKAMTAYLYLRTLAEKDDALAKIPAVLIKGKALLGRYNGLIAPSSQESEPNAKRPRSQISSTSASTGAAPISATALADAVVPWHNVPYEEQLERKHKEIQSALRTFTTKLRAHVRGDALYTVLLITCVIARKRMRAVLKRFASACGG